MGDNRQRPVIDLDELERQLRAAAGPRERVSPPPSSDDPLAELARIVGQDDPQKSYWNAHAPAPREQREPSFDGFVDAAQGRAPADLGYDDHHAAPAVAAHDPYARAPEPEWAMRTSLHDDRHAPQPPHDGYSPEAEPLYEEQGQLPPHAGDFDDEPRPVARKRGWLAIGAVLSVAVVGVAGAMVWRSPAGTKLASGLPPLIKADPSPSKVAPENPGGIEVPNQDRQIYAKGTPDDLKGVKLVGGEEQPLDVNQATRKDIPSAAAAAATTASTTTSPVVDAASMPKPSPGQVPGLGEARRVKTVSVRPDGTIIDPSTAAAPEPAPARVASLASAVDVPLGSAASGATPSPASVPSPRPKPLTTGTTTAATTPAKPKAPDAIAVASGAATPTTPKPAAAKPVQVASAAAEDAPAGGGAWAVQLAAPVSDQEARETSSRLEKRFAGELGGLKPAIRKADVNGKTIYRVRVSGLSRDDATALCSKLQASGGQCFVAKN